VLAKLRKATISLVMSVWLSRRKNLASTGWVFMKFYVWQFFENLSEKKYKFDYLMTRMTCALHEHQCTFLTLSRWIVMSLRKASDKICGESQNIELCSLIFFWISCPLCYSVKQYGTARQATDDDIIGRMHIACWVTKITDTNSEHVISIAFPRKHWVCERASVLRYTYIACCIYNYYNHACVTVIIL
jgi:hypothetical protein